MKVGIIRDRVYELIGLAMRAGKLASGSYQVEESIKSGKTHLVILSEEASPGTVKKFSNMCRNRDIEIIQMGSKETLGKALGKPSRTVLAVEEGSFKDMIIDALPGSTINMGVSDICQR